MFQSVWNFFKAIYSLDTLDTRFTSSFNAAQKSRQDVAQHPIEKNDTPAGPALPGSRPSKWQSREYYVYYAVVIIAVPLMVKSVYDVSRPDSPEYDRFSGLLSPGWIPGRMVDNTDSQYSNFRDNLPYLAIILILHPFLRKLYNTFWRIDSYTTIRKVNGEDNGLTQGLHVGAAANARLEHRISFDFMFAIALITALHGISALKILVILWLNFKIATKVERAYVPTATWTFNLFILVANELCQGYRFSAFATLFLPSAPSLSGEQPLSWGHRIDSFGGLNPRWEVLFNVTILRLISFNMDYYWALGRGSSSPNEKQLDPSLLSERDRISHGASLTDFSFRNYIAYALYAPLYLAGPIMTFNDFISQSRYPLPTTTHIRTFLYGIRFLLVLLCMEIVIHYLYVVAIIHSSPTWSLYSPFQLSMIGYFNLHHIWLKLVIPWRFFRLWSLIDNIDPPENMIRCMSDNYSTLAFWRAWHRSFNRWIIRYIYIPLGGGGSERSGSLIAKIRPVANFFAVFTFVALWHDLNPKLLAWGWLATLIVLPEALATMAFPKRQWKDWPDVYRWLCGAGAVVNILLLMVANTIGFVVGVDGARGLIRGMVDSWSGIAYLVTACATLFVGVQVMFEHREGEKRKGINLKC